MSEWASQNVRISSNSAEPGRIKLSRFPYQQGMMDILNDPEFHTVVIQSSAQIGKTLLLCIVIGYYVDYEPSPIMVVMPTLELAESFSKDRLAALIRDTPPLQQKFKDPRSRDSGNTLLYKQYPGGFIKISGANSPASLCSIPVKIILCDEVDRFPLCTGTEGDPIQLASKRSTSFYNRKLILTSTPTVKGTSRIESAFEMSDQRRFFVDCPYCKHPQYLKWEQIKYKESDPETVHYECESCKRPIDQREKPILLTSGRWLATSQSDGVAGFHLNELYSPFRTWTETVKDYLIAKQNVEQLKVFTNTALGETFQERGEAPDWSKLHRMRESYSTGPIPDGVLVITAGADVQMDRIEVEVVGWTQNGLESYSLGYFVIPGNTNESTVWKELDRLLNKKFKLKNGLELPIRMLAIDSGFRTQIVYNWARKHPASRVIATKGVSSLPVMVGHPKAVDINVKGRILSKGFKVWKVGVDVIKTELYSWLKLEKSPSDKSYPPGYCHFPAQYTDDYFKMLTAEELVTKSHRGYIKHEWRQVYPRNEALDCRVYARAAANVLGLDRYSPQNWKDLKIELRLEEKKETKPTSSKAPAKPRKQPTRVEFSLR